MGLAGVLTRVGKIVMHEPIAWTLPPPQLDLGLATVHLWRASLQVTPAQVADHRAVLSTDEQARAQRFKFDRDRRRFIAARGILRQILSRYIPQSPAAHQFHYGAYGKPTLIQAVARPSDRLEFNVSHSADWAVYAIARQPVGVDLEQIRPVDVFALAERCFQPQEVAWLQQCAEATAQQAAFFQLWTVKEACLKAIGAGIGQLATISVTWGEPPQIDLDPAPNPAPAWWVHRFTASPNCPAAIAIARSSADGADSDTLVGEVSYLTWVE